MEAYAENQLCKARLQVHWALAQDAEMKPQVCTCLHLSVFSQQQMHSLPLWDN